MAVESIRHMLVDFKNGSQRTISEWGYASLRGALLAGANLSNLDIGYANLESADLRNANLSGSLLNSTFLIEADLRGANLQGAVLCYSNFAWADLRDADLRSADLRNAHLANAKLEGVKGLPSPKDFLDKLDKDDLGYIVYKRIGPTTPFVPPSHWKIEPNEILTEECEMDRRMACARGVNFGTLAWCNSDYIMSSLWRCRIRYEWEDLVCVPYATDGKARTSKLELLERV